MSGSDLALAVFLGAFPLLFVYWWSARAQFRARLAENESDPDGVIRLYRRRTLVLTLIPAALLAVWVYVDGNAVARGAKSWFPLLHFHLVWWLGVFPLLRRGGKRAPGMPGDSVMPGEKGLPTSDGGVRSATLAARDARDFLPTWWWTLPIAIFVTGLGVIAWHVARGPVGGLLESSRGATLVIVLPLCALSCLVGYGWWARHIASGAQDLTGAVDPEALATAYDRFRRFLVRGIFWLMTASIALFMGAAVAHLLTDGGLDGRLGGLVGGVGGSLVGLLGAAFGTVASIQRMKLDRIRRHGSAAPSAPPKRTTAV